MPSSINNKLCKDTLQTILIGPLKFVVPTFSTIVLYPLIIARSNIEVLGLWSLFASVVTFINVADIGFSQLLTREAVLDQNSCSYAVAMDYIAARRTYYFFLIFLVIMFLCIRNQVLTMLSSNYSANALSISILLLLIGSIIQLIAKLNAAILSAWHENVTVQLTTALSPIFTFTFALLGAWFSKPIEGMVLGTLLSGIVTVVVLQLKMEKVQPSWCRSMCMVSITDSMVRLPALLRRGWYLYSTSLGLLIRAPIYRFIIATFLGLHAVASFDIAMRLTQTARELISSGFSALYPSFTFYFRCRENRKIVQLIRLSLLILLGGGTLLIGVIIAESEPLLKFWLGTIPQGVISSVRILGLWQILTLLNVPFWYLLQAAHLERVAAFSIWAHTALIVILLPLSSLLTFSLHGLLSYWALTSILTQIFIYYFVQSRLKLLWTVLHSPSIYCVFMLSIIFVFLCLGYFYMLPIIAFISITFAYFLVLTILVFKPFQDFVKTVHIFNQ